MIQALTDTSITSCHSPQGSCFSNLVRGRQFVKKARRLLLALCALLTMNIRLPARVHASLRGTRARGAGISSEIWPLSGLLFQSQALVQ
jgi:hypothetical protein